ncbi:MAG: NYN domain-containing protein, partial [Reyranellaceae bacterium]
ALVIDAMDLLHSKRFNGFCLVSSDSDFTRLAMRQREEGVTVYGFGEKKTPRAFVAACDKFIYTEILRPPAKRAAGAARAPARAKAKPAARPPVPPASAGIAAPPLDVLRDAVDSSTDESGWAHLGQVGRVLNNRLPDFDARNFGYRSIGAMLEALDGFEIRRQGGPGQQQSVYVRTKPGV